MKSENISIDALRCAPASFVEAPVENETQRVLRRALELLGPNGERWHNVQAWERNGCYCALGALKMVMFGRPGGLDYHGTAPCVALEQACRDIHGRGGISSFNDNCPAFSLIQAIFERAIELAGTQS